MEAQETFTITGPQLQVLGEAEDKLPAPLRKKPVAGLFVAVCALIAVLLMGGVKLKGSYHKAADQFANGSPAEPGYSISFLLDQSTDYAANIITTAKGLGCDVTDTQAALDALLTAKGPAASYQANNTLVSKVQYLYEQARPLAVTAGKDGALQTQYSEFLEQTDKINHLDYNQVATDYNKSVRGFPASLVAGMWGAGEVELFA